MEDTGLYRDNIWFESEKEFGGFKWMGDIGFSAFAKLYIMGISGKYIGPPDSILHSHSLSIPKISDHRVDDLLGELV
jgi:hypothetical protein